VEDVFRINWFKNARFSQGKVYVIRLNPSMYSHKDGMLSFPPMKVRLAKLLQLLRFLYEGAVGEDPGTVNFVFFFGIYKTKRYREMLLLVLFLQQAAAVQEQSGM
jgi:hypothetical protein